MVCMTVWHWLHVAVALEINASCWCSDTAQLMHLVAATAALTRCQASGAPSTSFLASSSTATAGRRCLCFANQSACTWSQLYVHDPKTADTSH